METTGIRLDVEPWLYEALCEEQEHRRLKNVRKQSLSMLVIEFCTKGMAMSGHFEQNKPCSVQNIDDSTHEFVDSVKNGSKEMPQTYEANLTEIARMKESLLRRQVEMQEKERLFSRKEYHVQEKENELREKELELVEKSRVLLQQWNEILECKEQSQQKSLDKAPQKLQFERQSQELIDKNEAIKKMKQENIQLKEDIIKTLRKIDQQTEKNIIFDYIVPFLPSVISIIGFFMTNRKIDNIQELSPVQAEIGNIMKKLSDTDRKILSAKLEESLKSVSVKPAPDK